MARQVSQKNIKTVDICKCGLHSVEDFKTTDYTWRMLRQLRATLKKYTNTGERFFLLKSNYDSCYSCNPELI